MTNRRIKFLSFAFAALVALLVPALDASAQVPWPNQGRNRDYERDRQHRHDNDDEDDRHYERDGRYDNYDRRELRNLARRVNDRSKELERDVDRLLDSSRINGTNREDHINQDVRDFRNAAERFKDRAGDGRNLNNSANEARALLQAAEHVSQYLRRLRLDSRTSSDWSQLRYDLRAVANIYGYDFRDNNNGSYRGRNDDDYRRNRDRNRRNNPNDRGWRWPF